MTRIAFTFALTSGLLLMILCVLGLECGLHMPATFAGLGAFVSFIGAAILEREAQRSAL